MEALQASAEVLDRRSLSAPKTVKHYKLLEEHFTLSGDHY
jgi:hypothetical protein